MTMQPTRRYVYDGATHRINYECTNDAGEVVSTHSVEDAESVIERKRARIKMRSEANADDNELIMQLSDALHIYNRNDAERKQHELRRNVINAIDQGLLWTADGYLLNAFPKLSVADANAIAKIMAALSDHVHMQYKKAMCVSSPELNADELGH